jgi:hypothetical protein
MYFAAHFAAPPRAAGPLLPPSCVHAVMSKCAPKVNMIVVKQVYTCLASSWHSFFTVQSCQIGFLIAPLVNSVL